MTLETKVEVQTSEYVDAARYIFTVEPGGEEYTTRFSVYDNDAKRTVVSSTLRSDRMVDIMSTVNNAIVDLGIMHDRKLQRMKHDLAELRSHILGGTVEAIKISYLSEGLNEVLDDVSPVPCVDLRVELFHTPNPRPEAVPIGSADFTIRATHDHFGMLIHSFMGYNYVNSIKLAELRKLCDDSVMTVDSRIEAALRDDLSHS